MSSKTIREIVESLSAENYEALKVCMTKEAGLILTPEIPEKEQIIGDLEDAYKYPDGWVTPLRQLLEKGDIKRIRELARSLKASGWLA